MDFYIISVFLCLLLSLIIIFSSLNLKKSLLSLVFKLFIFIGIAKYISLLVLHSANSVEGLYSLRYLPFLSLISIFSIGYITLNFIKVKDFNIINFVILFGISLTGFVIALNIPNSIVILNESYVILKNSNWVFMEHFYYIILSIVLIGMCIYKILKSSNTKHKACFILIALGFIPVIIEQIMFILNKNSFYFNILGDISMLSMISIVLIIKSSFKK